MREQAKERSAPVSGPGAMAAEAWDDIYDVDVNTLRSMVSHTSRRFEQGMPRKKRKLVTRAMDMVDLTGMTNPKVSLNRPCQSRKSISHVV